MNYADDSLQAFVADLVDTIGQLFVEIDNRFLSMYELEILTTPEEWE